MLDFFRKKRFLKKSDISIGDLIEHHFGKDFLFKTIGPLVNGVFSGNLYRMSAKMCFPQWWNYAQNWGSLSRGWWNERKKKTESSKGFKPDGGLVSPSKGMESLVQHIQDYLNKNRIRIICNAPLKHVILSNEEERNNRKKKHKLVYQHLEHEYDHVIFCIPPPILKRLFRSKRVDPVATSAINPFQTMDLNPVVMVTVAYSRYMSEIPKGFGTLVAPGENTPLLSIVMHSRIFPNKCVSGTEVLHGVIGGEYFPEWIDKSNQELENFMVSELRRIWNITDMPLFFDVNRHMFGMPQFHTGHRESLQKVYDEYPNSLGIHFGGATFWGSGINNAIKGGKKMAEEIQKSYNES